MSDEAIIGNLLDRIRARFKADPNWGVYDGMLCRSDLEVLLDIISALESDKINNTMNLEHLTADLAAMTADRDEWRRRAEAAETDITALARRAIDGFQDTKFITPCRWCAEREQCDLLTNGMNTCFKWRGPEEDKPC